MGLNSVLIAVEVNAELFDWGST